MGFTDQIRTIARDFQKARNEKFGQHKLADQIRKNWPDSIKNLLAANRVSQYQFDASPGKGEWSKAPFLAILHPAITKTSRDGFYPVYQFEPEFKMVCLVMGQGVERLKAAWGVEIMRVELTRRAELLRTQGGEWEKYGFEKGPFAAAKTASKKHPWSTAAFGKRYQINKLPTDIDMAKDLVEMLNLYDKMANIEELRSFSDFDKDEEEGELPSDSIDGAKKVFKHREFERRQRNKGLITKVKEKLGLKCQACTFSFAQMYGEGMAGFIEAHHKVPLSTLPDEGAILTATTDDFIVLCSNCHRAIHRAGCPDLKTFKKSLYKK